MKFDYHSKTKKLIASGHLVYFETVAKYNSLAPALLLYFDDRSVVAVEKEKWKDFSDIILSTLENY